MIKIKSRKGCQKLIISQLEPYPELHIHNECTNLRLTRDVFVPSFVTLASFSSLWPAFTLTVHINALYNESVHGREEHAT